MKRPFGLNEIWTTWQGRSDQGTLRPAVDRDSLADALVDKIIVFERARSSDLLLVAGHPRDGLARAAGLPPRCDTMAR